MAVPPIVPDLRVTLYQYRCEEFGTNFESMRRVEWQTTFQTYTGYGAVAVAYAWARHAHPASALLGYGALAVIVILFWSTLYLSRRVQERLRFTRAMQNVYIRELHRVVGVNELPRPADVPEPIHKHSYAPAVQTLLSATMAITLFVYVYASSLRAFCG